MRRTATTSVPGRAAPTSSPTASSARDWPLGADASDHGASFRVSLVDRRPDEATLEHWVWDGEQVFRWIAVRCGVHYSLVQYWLSEADIVVKRRNVPDPPLERVDAMRG